MSGPSGIVLHVVDAPIGIFDSGYGGLTVARAVLEEQSFENRMLKAYIRDWPAEG